jgi:hypothetical protein
VVNGIGESTYGFVRHLNLVSDDAAIHGMDELRELWSEVEWAEKIGAPGNASRESSNTSLSSSGTQEHNEYGMGSIRSRRCSQKYVSKARQRLFMIVQKFTSLKYRAEGERLDAVTISASTQDRPHPGVTSGGAPKCRQSRFLMAGWLSRLSRTLRLPFKIWT